MTTDTVLWSLFEALEAGRGLAWAAEHAATSDPVPAAWATSCDDLAMRMLAERAGRPRPWTQCRRHAEIHLEGAGCADCAGAIRRRVPTLTLAEVLRGARKDLR